MARAEHTTLKGEGGEEDRDRLERVLAAQLAMQQQCDADSADRWVDGLLPDDPLAPPAHDAACRLVEGLCDTCRAQGYWKLIAKVFPFNETSIGLLRRCGFRDVGLHHRHGRLDGKWLDVLVLERSL